MSPNDDKDTHRQAATAAHGRSAAPMAVTDHNVEDLMTAPLAIVVVTDVGSANGARYLAELSTLPADGELAGVAVGVVERGELAGSRLAREQPWLTGLRLFPYTMIFAAGRRVDAFAAVRADVLLARLARFRADEVETTSRGPAHLEGTDGDWWSIPLGSWRPAA